MMMDPMNKQLQSQEAFSDTYLGCGVHRYLVLCSDTLPSYSALLPVPKRDSNEPCFRR